MSSTLFTTVAGRSAAQYTLPAVDTFIDTSM
jgi:hypothetical protein